LDVSRNSSFSSCSYSEFLQIDRKHGVSYITIVTGRGKGKLNVDILPRFQMRSEGKKKTRKKE